MKGHHKQITLLCAVAVLCAVIAVAYVVIVVFVLSDRVHPEIVAGHRIRQRLRDVSNAVTEFVITNQAFPDSSAREAILRTTLDPALRVSNGRCEIHLEGREFTAIWLPDDDASLDARSAFMVFWENGSPHNEIWLLFKYGDVNWWPAEGISGDFDWQDTWVTPEGFLVKSRSTLEAWSQTHLELEGRTTVESAGSGPIRLHDASRNYAVEFYYNNKKLIGCTVSRDGISTEQTITTDAAGRIVSFDSFLDVPNGDKLRVSR